MKRRDFLVSSVLGSAAIRSAAAKSAATTAFDDAQGAAPNRKRKILIAGGGFGEAFIRYMATLTGKPRHNVGVTNLYKTRGFTRGKTEPLPQIPTDNLAASV